MKQIKIFGFLIISAILFSLPSAAFAGNWTIDSAHSFDGFKIKHMMISDVRGSFRDVQGTAVFDANDLKQAKVNVEIAAASIDTGIKKRDDHLRSADFFDVEKYPTLTFTSKQVKNISGDNFTLVGDLTIHGVTKEVELAVTGPTAEMKDPWGNTRRAAKATTEINRKDFGLTWNSVLEAGGVLVGDEVQIEIEVQFIKQAG